MKNTVKYLLQRLLGYKLYLFVFAVFKIKTLKNDSKENDFFFFLNAIPSKEGAILDIGANLGIMTFFLSKQFPDTAIYSIEPVPSNFSVLTKIKHWFGLTNVEILTSAVGADNKTVTMILPTNKGTKMQGLSHVKHKSMELWNEGIEFDVQMNTLDDLFLDKTIKAIKMDVENFEFFVLQGGKHLIQKNMPIIYMELWNNENRVNCLQLLHEMNYECFVIEKNQAVIYQSAIHTHQNFLFKPKK